MITDKTFRTFENLEHFDRVYKKSQVAILILKLWLHFALSTVQTFLSNDTLNFFSQSCCTVITAVDVRPPWNSLGCKCEVIFSIPHKLSVYLFLLLPQCEAPTDTKPIVMGIAGSTFVAVYNVSGTICVFQESSKHVTEGKVYLSNGQELKTVAPDVKLPTVEHGVVISDKKDGHYIIFFHKGAGAPRSFTFTNAKNVKEKTAVTLGDDPDLEAYPIYDIDKKNLVSGKATIPSASIASSPISSNEPMTVYSAELTPDSGWLTKHSYTGDDVSLKEADI